MKKKITSKLLFAACAKSNGMFIPIYLLIIAAAVVCLAIVPYPAGIIAAAAAVCVGVILFFRLKSSGSAGNPEKSYLSLRELTDKKEIVERDSETGDSYRYILCFGEDSLETDRKTYDAANAGQKFYLAYFDKNDQPFAYFDESEYEPDSGVTVRP